MTVTEGTDSVRAVLAARAVARRRDRRTNIATTIRWLQALRRETTPPVRPPTRPR
jgi:hypothetical protein